MVDRLALSQLADDEFESREPTDDHHVFGGLLIGHALRAGASTVPAGRSAHSLHASFVAAGTGGERVRYSVERTRDGDSFTTRRVVAAQGDAVLLVLIAGFHHDEPGVDYEQPAVAGVPGPDGLPAGRYQTPWFACRDVPVGAAPAMPLFARRSWFRPAVPLPDDPDLHQQALAYLSDHGATRAARAPHDELTDDARRMSVSLDHSVWFHRPVDVNGWLLSEFAPVATGGGRGLSLGSIRTEEGRLVATVAQEVLLRSLKGDPE
jgi:acyl-CoA thioesterase-2